LYALNILPINKIFTKKLANLLLNLYIIAVEDFSVSSFNGKHKDVFFDIFILKF